jgi:hypothetical protein
MKAAVLLTLLAIQTAAQAAAPTDDHPIAKPENLHYKRTLTLPTSPGQACAVLDSEIYSKAAPSLKDLRIFPETSQTAHEIPYALTLSESVQQETHGAQVLNLGQSGKDITFDLAMPDGPYTDVLLDLDGHDFLATARVSGADSLESLHAGKSTALGSYTLFDLTDQRLSRDLTLPLQETSFRYLHVVLSLTGAAGNKSFTAAPGMVLGAEVPPSREAQTLYTTVAQTSAIATAGRQSIATFTLPVRVPVERVSFTLAPTFKGNFSRDIQIKATPENPPPDPHASSGGEPAFLPETLTGTILRVHTTQEGRELRSEQLSLPATLGANLQHPAKVEVIIENGDDQPLPIVSVRLEMRQRRLCFESLTATQPNSMTLALFYGDPTLLAPVYDYARLFTASDQPLTATLGPEQVNPIYHPRPSAERPFTERHPEVLWIALLAVVCALGLVALKSSRTLPS